MLFTIDLEKLKKKKIKNQYYIRIKYIKSDNRTEFNDNKFKSFCLIYDI